MILRLTVQDCCRRAQCAGHQVMSCHCNLGGVIFATILFNLAVRDGGGDSTYEDFEAVALR
jgi:hypothetical protein